MKLSEIDVLQFAPGGILLIGVGSKLRIVALKTGDTKPSAGTCAGIRGFVSAIAEKIGGGVQLHASGKIPDRPYSTRGKNQRARLFPHAELA